MRTSIEVRHWSEAHRGKIMAYWTDARRQKAREQTLFRGRQERRLREIKTLLADLLKDARAEVHAEVLRRVKELAALMMKYGRNTR